MGMSASQARLLTLTARLSDLELKAQQISNNKIRLAMDSEKVAKDYSDALDKEKITLITGYNGTTPQYGDLTYKNLTSTDSPLMSQYGVSDSNGNLLVTKDQAKHYVDAAGDKNAFLRSYNALGYYKTTGEGTDPAVYAAAQQKVEDTRKAYTEGVVAIKGTPYETALNNLNAYGAAHVQGYTTAGAWSYTTTTSTYNQISDNMTNLMSYANKVQPQNGTSYKTYATEMKALIGTLDSQLNNQIQDAYKALTGNTLSDTQIANMDWNNLSFAGTDGSTKYLRAKSDVDVSTGAKGAIVYTTAAGSTSPSASNVVLNSLNTTNYDATAGVGKELDELIRMRRNLNSISTLIDTYDHKNASGSDASLFLSTAISLLLQGGNPSIYSGNGPFNAFPALVSTILNNGDDDGSSGGVSFRGPLDNDLLRPNLDYDYGEIWSKTKGGATAYAGGDNTFTENLSSLMAKYSTDCSDEGVKQVPYSSADSTDGLANIKLNSGDLATYTGLLNTFKTTPLPKDGKGNDIDVNDLLNKYNQAQAELNALTPPPTTSYVKGTNEDYYSNLFERMKDGKYTTVGNQDETATLDNASWLQNQLLNGNLIMEKVDSTGKWQQTSYRSDTNFVEKSDDKDTAKAEAKYQADSASIQAKDKRFDTELTQINTEHTSIQTEIDSVKKVIDKNIERSFKIFDA